MLIVKETEALFSLSENVMGEAGMRLTKWLTSKTELSKFVEAKKLVGSIIKEQLGMKLLGFSCNVKIDKNHFDFAIFFNCLAEKHKLSKRIALRLVSSV